LHPPWLKGTICHLVFFAEHLNNFLVTWPEIQMLNIGTKKLGAVCTYIGSIIRLTMLSLQRHQNDKRIGLQ
jgi:hypothetical protein